jgi:1-acyl-sn-glycerol-3-phosphate acyltransferase
MKANNPITQILWLPWTLWCTLLFVLVVAIMLPFLFIIVWINNDKLTRWAHYVPSYLSRMLLVMWGVRLQIVGKELMKPEDQLIYISNHMSYLDAFVAAAAIPNFVKYLGKAEILAWPGLGYLLKKFYVPVKRDDPENRHWSMEQMNEKLKTGASFFICPEGTCNTSGELLKYFHKGAFRLAIENKIPIVPLTFIGTANLFPRSGFMLRPGKIIVYWHQAIPTSNMSEDDIDALVSTCTDIMKHHLISNTTSKTRGKSA